MNYIENLPTDLILEIYFRVHKLYMLDLQNEIYERAVEYWEDYEDNLDSDYSASSSDTEM